MPAHILSLNTLPYYNTGNGNYIAIRVVNPAGKPVDYEIFFKVTKVSRRLLRLYVSSASVCDVTYQSQQPALRKIGFFIIAYSAKSEKSIIA
ncbi:hypothetical protein ACFOY8_12445 [Thalassospira xianhensis]|uniref:hypothetical protein n=1 Tax=Thalassospira xianhensis TaxID=478503 RepID=UPI0011BDF9B1|nr:hypothetical protein [Thalassospira xianhensis]